MSGLKHHFSIEGDPNGPLESQVAKDDDNEIDPVDECKWKASVLCELVC